MSTQSSFYYPLVLHKPSGDPYDVLAPAILALPSPQSVDERSVILLASVGDQQQGLYVFDEVTWRFALSMKILSIVIVSGDSMEVFINPLLDETVSVNVEVYKNGYLQSDDLVKAGRAIYAVRTLPTTGTVDSVNGQTGTVVLTASDITGISQVGKTGQYGDLIGAPGPYTLPAATSSVLGGVKVPGPNLSVDVTGAVDVSPALLTTINNKLGNVQTSGAGTSIINSVAAGTLTLKSIVAGPNIDITDAGATITLGVTTLNEGDF